MKMMVLLVLQKALLSSENTLSSNPCMPKGEPRGLAKGEVLKRRSMSGPEETMGGTLAPRQKSTRGGGGGAPASGQCHHLSIGWFNCRFWLVLNINWFK